MPRRDKLELSIAIAYDAQGNWSAFGGSDDSVSDCVMLATWCLGVEHASRSSVIVMELTVLNEPDPPVRYYRARTKTVQARRRRNGGKLP